MIQLTYLVDEICAGLEIYFTGRRSNYYDKTAFILCDDYTELTSKLFLLTDNPAWSDAMPTGGFKNYYKILKDVHDVLQTRGFAQLDQVDRIHDEMKARRKRRNDFFHSTGLLDLNVNHRTCVHAFCDLLDYGRLLFESKWDVEVSASRSLETLEIILRLEKKNLTDSSIQSRIDDILSNMLRNRQKVSKKGMHVAVYPEDLHLRLSVIHGGQELRDKLRALL
jgi:hypothetical protein